MIKDGLLAEFDHEVATTRRLLDRLPDDLERLAWKPHGKSMSLGGLATHISNLPVWGATILNASSFRSGGDAAERAGEDVAAPTSWPRSTRTRKKTRAGWTGPTPSTSIGGR